MGSPNCLPGLACLKQTAPYPLCSVYPFTEWLLLILLLPLCVLQCSDAAVLACCFAMSLLTLLHSSPEEVQNPKMYGLSRHRDSSSALSLCFTLRSWMCRVKEMLRLGIHVHMAPAEPCRAPRPRPPLLRSLPFGHQALYPHC